MQGKGSFSHEASMQFFSTWLSLPLQALSTVKKLRVMKGRVAQYAHVGIWYAFIPASTACVFGRVSIKALDTNRHGKYFDTVYQNAITMF